MYHYVGNIHLHSTYSDGFASIKQIAQIAEEEGLDFIIITDHFHLVGLPEQGYYGQLMLLVGMEINEEDNHYLALDVSEVIANGKAQKVIDEVNLQKGIGIIAHPDEKGSPFYENYKTYRWNDWSVHGFQGIEVWNFLSQYKDEITGIFKGIYLLFFPHAALKGPYKETLDKLDNYQKKDLKIFAYGGSDAHGIKIKLGPILLLTISPYDLCFKCINTHIISDKKLSGNTNTDKELVYQSLRQGRFWISYDYFKNSKGFQFLIRSPREKWLMGEDLPYQKSLYAEIKTPYKALVKLIKDGQIYGESRGRAHRFPITKKGVYRIEAYHKHLFSYRLWIFSNPIWVK